MENDQDEDPMLKQNSDQLIQLICEAISSSSTEDKIWVPLEKIREYVESYYEGNLRNIEKSLIPTLRILVTQELIIRRANTFCFMSAETDQLQAVNEKIKEQKNPTKNIKTTKKKSKK